ncbi:MAG TPA: tetratricopeptide repeat protein [Gemmatimonadales bacterium]|nr:tetratricopeptide repeat protein [Gemmatimonadales bacterium]
MSIATSLSDESALLRELSAVAERGRPREMLERLAALPVETREGRTPFALLAAEAHGRLGEHDEADRWAAMALTAARARGERHAELRARHYQGAIALERGDVDAAERHVAAALDLARALRDHPAEARCHNNLGIIANLRGDPQAALASYQLALAAYQQAGLVRGIAETHHNIGISWRDLGNYVGAYAAADEALRLAEHVEDESLATQALAGRAELHLREGDTELAAAELTRATAAYERLRYPAGLAEVWRLQAGVARARGDAVHAVALLRQAAALALEHGSAPILAEIERDLGAALEATGEPVEARVARERAIALYRRFGARKAADELAARTAQGA